MNDIVGDGYDNIQLGLAIYDYHDDGLISYQKLGNLIPEFHRWCIVNEVPDFVALCKTPRKYLQLYCQLYDVDGVI